MITMRAWSYLIAGVAAVAVGTATAATIEHARAKTARAIAITLASTCTADYGITTGDHGQSITVATLTCPRPAAQSASKAPL